MKSNEILQALKLPKSKNNMQHCGKLSGIYLFLKQVKTDIIKAEIIESNIELLFGRGTKDGSEWNGDFKLNVINEGIKVNADKIQVSTNYGNYSFAIPVNNAFYSAIYELLDIAWIKPLEQTVKPVMSIILPIEALQAIGRAAKFVSKDSLRPAMQQVCINIKNCKAEIAATNAHYLFISQYFETDIKETMQILFPAETAKKIAALKTDCDIIELHILPDGKAMINDLTFDTLDARFFDYKVVVPEYKTYMQFNRKELVSTIKQVLPFTNKCTGQVNFHLNCNISLSGQDVDFGFETVKDMPYKQKTFKDSDIGFNGKLFIECLNNFKDAELKMYSDGHPSKAVLLTNDVETVLLMPLYN